MKNTLFFILIVVGFASLGQSENNISLTHNKATHLNSTSQSDIALKFINEYVENCNKTKNAVKIEEWVNTNKLVTNCFKNGLKKIIDEAKIKNSDSGLDFDPIFNAQDYPEKGFTLESIDKLTNYIVVRGIDWNEFKVKIKVTVINGNWLIDGCGRINIPNDEHTKK